VHLCMPLLATGIYYLLKGEQEFRGPFSEDEVIAWYRSGWFTSTTIFRVGDKDASLGEWCNENGSACPFRIKKESTSSESLLVESHEVQLRKLQDQLNINNRLLLTSNERCAKLEQIVSSFVERFLITSGEFSDIKSEKEITRSTEAYPSTTSTTTTATASAASSSSSLNLLLQLRDDLNTLGNVVHGETDNEIDARLHALKIGDEMKNRKVEGGEETMKNETEQTRATTDYTSLTRRISVLESGLRDAKERIEAMKAGDLSHVLESIDRVSEEMSASQNEIKSQRALDRGSQLVIEDSVKSLMKDRTVDQERLTEVERFMGGMMAGTENTNDLITVKTIRKELKAANERDEFNESRLYIIEDKLMGIFDQMERVHERLTTLEETMTKMPHLDTFKSMLTNHTDELMSRTSEEVLMVNARVDRVEQTAIQLSITLSELNKAVDGLLDKTQSTGRYDHWQEDEYRTEDEDDEEEEDHSYRDEGFLPRPHYDENDHHCKCSMCREGKTPKVINDLLNGHYGNFDHSRIATRSDLIDIRDALSVCSHRRSSFLDDTRHYFGKGVHCYHCDVTIHEGASLLSHASSERHAQAACILKEDLRFWWNRIRDADE
ncbi:hypothetical protein PMAYCL1PPCAC_30432, partial [Pristionchus mayeri]